MSMQEVLSGDRSWWVECGDARTALAALPDGCVQSVCCSPPYFGLRSYGVGTDNGEIGLEKTPAEFVAALVAVFAEVGRVMRDDGTFWVNMGDSYASGETGRKDIGREFAGGRTRKEMDQPCRRDRRLKCDTGLKHKDLLGMPWRFAFAMQEAGWYLRDAITWIKQSPMPESVRDRTTKATEMIFLFTKKPRYFYDQYAVRGSVAEATIARDAYSRILADPDEQFAVRHDHETVCDPITGRNLWNWWALPPESFKGKHYAVYPRELPRRCLSLGTSDAGCCPRCGKCWVRVVEKKSRPSVAPSELDRFGDGSHGVHRKVGQAYQRWLDENPDRTAGWKPACKCPEAAPIPCLTMDCFSGAGTTGLVARRLGRRYIGIELNEEYAAMSRERITNDAPLFNSASSPDGESEERLLFEEET